MRTPSVRRTVRVAPALIDALIRIDSVNPALAPGHAGEAELARYVRSWAEARGLETSWLASEPGRPSVIVRARGRGGGRTLMLNAHLDTVGTAGMDAPFEPRRRDGRLYARGAMDMKASLAACMETLAWVQAEGDLAGDVVLTAVADEEHDSVGTRAALAAVGADMAVVTEPTDLALHVAHRGFALVEVELTGKASHTSQPERGVNAVRQLGRLLAEVDRADAALRARPAHPRLGYGSWQPVLAAGGQELFTTPAHAAVTLERRTLPGESAARGAEEEVRAMLSAVRVSEPDLRPAVRTAVAREAFEAPDGSMIVEEVAGAVRSVAGRDPQRVGAPYWTDAALIAEAGIPTVLFGPIGGGIHQPDEWVDLASVDTVASVLRELARRVCA